MRGPGRRHPSAREGAPRRRPKALQWRAAVWSGIIAGVVFLALEMLLWPLAGLGGPWDPVRMIAAILLGTGALPPPSGFDPGVALAAVVVHFSLSVTYATVYAGIHVWVLGTRFPWARPFADGLFGLTIYVINFYGFTALFPWFIEGRHSVSILVHVAWGMVLPAAYEAKARGGAATASRDPDVEA